jgi:tight adherence protein C
MSAMDVLVWITSFLAIALMTYGVVLVFSERQIMKKRMAPPRERPAAISALKNEEPTHPFKRRLMNWLSLSGQWGLKDEDEAMGVRTLLIHAGFRHSKAPAIFYGIRALTGLVFPVPFLIFILSRGTLEKSNLLLALMLGGLGFFLPEFLLRRLVERRQERIDRALPDVIDLLIICIEAGLALQASINRVAEEIKDGFPELSLELVLTAGEMRAGISREVAMKNLVQRCGVQSVRSLVTLMIQSEKMGTTMGQALRVHAEFSRTQRALRAEEIAAKIPVKMVLPLIFLIMPPFFVIAVGPAVIMIFKYIFPVLKTRWG